jgi:peptidyl-arginine deiminase
MPAEWEPHAATWLAWPHNPDTWPGCLEEARAEFEKLVAELARFERVELLPAARRFRAVLDEHTQGRGWAAAAAVTTIFLEGTDHERGELDEAAPKRPAPPLEQHPLVVHYGLPLDALALTKAHRRVEGSHRAAAWRAILDHVAPDARAGAVAAVEAALGAWLAYRDEVAAACGLVRA